jgi:anti-anti-sigma factor
MTALSFIGSAAMQMIIAACQVFRHDGGTLALVHPASTVAWTLGLAGVSQLITVCGSVDEAISSAG